MFVDDFIQLELPFDVTLDPARLELELATIAGYVACIADAYPAAECKGLPPRPGCGPPNPNPATERSPA